MAKARTAQGGTPAGARRRKRRRKSPVVPVLVLLTAAGSAGIASYILFFRNVGLLDSDDEAPITAQDIGAVGRGQSGQIKLENRETHRREAIIEYDQWDPIGQSRYDATNPRAWIYLKTGEHVFLRADAGRFIAPNDQRPQSGVLSGNVIVRIFDPSEDLPKEDDPCAAEFRMASVSFDTEYGAAWRDRDPAAPDERVVIRSFPLTDAGVRSRSPEVEFVSHDLRVVVSQAQQRIERLECTRGERITYTPAPSAPTLPGGDQPDPSPDEPPVGAGPAPAVGQRFEPARTAALRPVALHQPGSPSQAKPEEPADAPVPPADPGARRRRADSPPPVLYLATFQEDIRLSQDEVAATGDSLSVWARTVDGRLPAGAIGGPFDAGKPRGRRSGALAPSTGAPVADQLRSMLAGVAIAASERRWPPVGLPARTPGSDQPASQASPPDTPATTPTATTPTAATDVPSGLAPGGEAPPAAPPPADAVLTGGLRSDMPVTLTWAGPLDLRPLREEPEELRREHLSARLVGRSSGGVHVLDASSGADALCSALDFGFTSRRLIASGLGESGARFSLPGRDGGTTASAGAPSVGGSGTLLAGRIEYATATGVGRVPGAGTLEGGPLQRIRWTEQMDFVLQSQGERVLSTLQDVLFRGGVQAEDNGASFSGEFAHAQFAPDPRRTRIAALTLEDNAQLQGREGERLAAPNVRIEFESDQGGSPQPSWVSASDGVIATRPGERLAAGSIEAALVRGEDGHADIRRFEADGGVDLRSRVQGIEILGRSMDADVPAQRLHVMGSSDALARVTRGATTIRGEDIRLFGDPREARVLGGGSFSHESARDAAPSAQFSASWSQAMQFDDASGMLHAVGDVDASVTEGSARVDRLRAWTVEATLDPAPPRTSAPASTDGAASILGSADASGPDLGLGEAGEGGGRRLRTLEAIGSLADSPEGEPASIELRRYAGAAVAAPAPDAGASGGDPQRVLQQLLYVEGARIKIDNQQGTLDVPGAGKLLVSDRRTPDAERESDATPFGGASARGDALFNWQGSLHVDRNSGEIRMTDHVVMVHKRAGDGLVTNLEAPLVSARASGGGIGASGGSSQPGHLTGVHAEGGVWVHSGQDATAREVTADVVDYDADTGILVAYSTGGGVVRVVENGGVWSASAVRWDVAAGRIEITSIGGGATPR